MQNVFSDWLYISLGTAGAAVVFAWVLFRNIMSKDPGDANMTRIAG